MKLFNNNVYQYLEKDSNTPLKKDSSVHFSDVRFLKAKEESNKPITSIELIINYVNEFLFTLGMNKIDNPVYSVKNNNFNDIYKTIENEYHLQDIRDIVWVKFTIDGYLGLVATSNDINFDIPDSVDSYNKKDKYGKWINNTAGILIHKLNKTWDDSLVLVFPLVDIPKEYSRHDIEMGIGNYLISKNVAILDYYSHNY